MTIDLRLYYGKNNGTMENVHEKNHGTMEEKTMVLYQNLWYCSKL